MRRQRAGQRDALLLAARELVRQRAGGMPARPTRSSICCTRPARSARGRSLRRRRPRCRPRSGAGTARSPGTPCRCGGSRAAPERRQRRRPAPAPSMRMRPADSGSRPATARSSVVLPQPEGPISTPICRRPDPATPRPRPGAALAAVAHAHFDVQTQEILDEYNSHLRWCAGAARAAATMRAMLARLSTAWCWPAVLVVLGRRGAGSLGRGGAGHPAPPAGTVLPGYVLQTAAWLAAWASGWCCSARPPRRR